MPYKKLCSIVTKPATLKWFWFVLNEMENVFQFHVFDNTVGANKINPNFSNFGVRFHGSLSRKRNIKFVTSVQCSTNLGMYVWMRKHDSLIRLNQAFHHKTQRYVPLLGSSRYVYRYSLKV